MLKGWLSNHWKETQAINSRLKSRGERFNQLYNAGGGSASDYLHADFGSKPIGGLDTKPWADQHIRIESLFKSQSFQDTPFLEKIADLRWGGWVPWLRNDSINVNPLWFSPLSFKLRAPFRMLKGARPQTMADIVPHEFIHTRQHYSDHSGWGRSAGNVIEWVGMNELSMPRKLQRKAARVFHDFKVAVSTRSATISGYYAKNVEMQARMHEILAHGYAQWQKMPSNRTELWAALTNLGLMSPKAIRKDLKNTEEGKKALEDFKVMRSIKSAVSGTVNTFNQVHEYAGESDSQKALWVTIYPMLYGELTEFYGDKLGRERMGMGTNPRPAVEVLHELKDHYETPFSDKKIQEMADKIPPTVAGAFLNTIICRCPDDGENIENAMAISRALLEKEDVKDVLFEDNQLAKNFTGHYEKPPLNVALLNGHHAMIELLIEAGASPFQTYTMYDMRMKPIFTGSPLDCAKNIVICEKNLANPSRLKGKVRKYYEDPENREYEEQRIEDRRAALQVMIDLYDKPDEVEELHVFGSDPEDVSLTDVLARIGITRNENARSLENELEVT